MEKQRNGVKRTVINGKPFEIIAGAVYYTRNNPKSVYVKDILESHKVLVIVRQDNIAYFGENIGHIAEFDAFTESVKYMGKLWTQVTHDFQITDKILYGEPELNVEFWDYECGDELISIAIDENGRRQDIIARYIDLNDISVE